LFSALMLIAPLTTCLLVAWLLFIGAGARSLVADEAAERFSETLEASSASAPDFTLPDLDGNQVSLSQFRGRPVVVNFWATWCPPCEAEIPHLIEAYEQEQGQVVFLAVSIGEPSSTVRRFAQEHGMPFIILLDRNERVAGDYQVRGIPATFFVTREGTIAMRYVGQMSPRVIEEGLGRIR